MELKRLEPADARAAFCCGDSDLNEFYFKDSIEGANELMSVTYAVVDDNEKIAAFFSVSNDSLARTVVPKKVWKVIPRPKRYKTWPATKIGRFGVCTEYQGTGLGSALLNFLKVWFTKQNKTGCRFLIVDAYNKEKVVNFYSKNGFETLPGEDGGDTKLMFFDLKTFRP